MLLNIHLKHKLYNTNVGLLDSSRLSLSELMLFIQTQGQKTYSTILFSNKVPKTHKEMKFHFSDRNMVTNLLTYLLTYSTEQSPS
jgi:hypothetical protein